MKPNNPGSCEGCGTALPEGIDGGLCPRCLLAAGLETTDSSAAFDDTLPTASASSIPTIEDLKVDFPEWEILEMIGRGGMGAVFKARQASLDRFVALKVLPSEWNTSANFRERFEREAKTLAALNHPNIVTIHEFGERAGRFFFTMEFVDGTDLERMIRGGEMASEQALGLIPQICEAIQFAHDHGVVHRDIKPANILVGRDGRVKVADFGIVKLAKGPEQDQEAEENPNQQPDLTAPRGVLGTPRYMAPEQAAASEELDHRADLYALGVVFYEMLVGTPPAKGKLTIAPSLSGKVSRRWDRIIMRALEEDPARRYQNATEIKTAVESVLAEQKRWIPGWLKAAAVAAAGVGIFFLWPGKDRAKDGPLVNSLGMRFVPVPGVEGLASVWETRVKDYQTFIKETGRGWTNPAFEQTPDHPVVQVSWHDALAFCEWLTARERKAGRLKEGEVYRLPTDREWSAMAHLPDEDGATPQERDLGQTTIFGWGEGAPVPEGAGNYPDQAGRDRFGSAAVPGYEDGFAATAPVGKFKASTDGIYDLGGNVWEWTDTPFSADDGHTVLRGGGWWAREADDGWKSLLASYRRADVETNNTEAWDVGFRVVRGSEPIETKADDFFRLVLEGDFEGVKAAVNSGVDVNELNRAGSPPVVLAAETGNLEMTQLLHELGANLETSDRRGRRPLHAAAELGSVSMVDWLLEQGVEPRPRTIVRQEPLLLAVKRAPIEVLEKLLAAGGPKALTATDTSEIDALTQASLSGSDETIRWIIGQLDADQIKAVPSEIVYLWLSWLAGRESSLLSDLLSKTSDRLSPEILRSAIRAPVNFDQEENFSLLLEAAGGDKLNETTMNAAGLEAAVRGRPWALKELIARGWSPKMGRDRLLHLAVKTPDELHGAMQALATGLSGEGNLPRARNLLERMGAQMPPPATRETIRLLAGLGLDLEARDSDHRTPLIAAAMKGNVEAVETLLDLGADVEAKDTLEFTPLLCAVEEGNLAMVKELDRHGADFAAVNKFGQGVLHTVHRHAEVLRFLLTKGLTLDRKDKNGMTPLQALAQEGDEEIIALLLEAGADVNAVITVGEEAGSTPLHLACVLLSERTLALEEQGRKAKAALGEVVTNRVPPADRDERERSIKLLVEAGADPLAKNARWLTPLHVAAKSGLPEAVELFLEKGADPNGLTTALNTPLQLAGTGGQLECARILLKHGAVTDSPTWQIPLLSSAIDGDNLEVVALFLEHRTPFDRRDVYGAFPLHQAAYNGQLRMVEILLDAGADPNVRDFQYRTPAHVAAAGNHREVVDLLNQRGARMNAADVETLTPAQLARSSGHSGLATHIESLPQNPVPRPNPANPKPEPPQ